MPHFTTFSAGAGRRSISRSIVGFSHLVASELLRRTGVNLGTVFYLAKVDLQGNNNN